MANHDLKNYTDSTWVAYTQTDITKSGKKTRYYYVHNVKNRAEGWVWSGYLKPGQNHQSTPAVNTTGYYQAAKTGKTYQLSNSNDYVRFTNGRSLTIGGNYTASKQRDVWKQGQKTPYLFVTDSAGRTGWVWIGYLKSVKHNVSTDPVQESTNKQTAISAAPLYTIEGESSSVTMKPAGKLYLHVNYSITESREIWQWGVQTKFVYATAPNGMGGWVMASALKPAVVIDTTGLRSQARYSGLTVPQILAQTSATNPMIFSHRGTLFDNPEHSFAGYSQAKAEGSSFLELDVYLTTDGKLMVSHDDNLLRTTGRNTLITQNTAAEIEKIPLGNGEHVHSLAEVFAKYGKTMHYVVEAKHDAATEADPVGEDKAAAKEIQEAGMSDYCIFQDFSLPGVEAFHQIAGETVTMLWLAPANAKAVSQAPSYLKLFSTNIATTTEKQVALEREKGLMPAVWTTDDAAGVKKAVETLKVDNVVANNTAEAFQILTQLFGAD